MVDVLPHTLLLPAAQIVVDRLPRWQIVRQKAPCNARPQEVEDGVDQLARCRLPRSTAVPSIRYHRRDQFPLRVCQIMA
jgi:hypothetical protein